MTERKRPVNAKFPNANRTPHNKLETVVNEVLDMMERRTGKYYYEHTARDIMGFMQVYQTAIMWCDAREQGKQLRAIAEKNLQTAYDAVAAGECCGKDDCEHTNE